MEKNLQTVKNSLAEKKIDAALISSLSNIIYLTNFSYFIDLEREAFLLITSKNYILTDARYSHAVKKYLKNFTLEEISTENSFINLLKKIIEQKKIKTLGIEENNITVGEYKKIELLIKNIKHFDLTDIRMIKQTEEIKKITSACQIGDKAFSYITKQLKLGITEKEVAYLLEKYIKEKGAELSFETIIAFEENAAVPHHHTGQRKLQKNEFVLIDFGVKFENYCSDMTRTIFFGVANEKQKKTYRIVYEAQQKAIEYIENGLDKKQTVNGVNADKTAREYIIKNKFPAFSHGLGHGIGLQVHEAPRLSPLSKDSLKNGMVFSIEPGIYLPDSMGIRIEDLFAIENNRLIQLTKSGNKLLEIPA